MNRFFLLLIITLSTTQLLADNHCWQQRGFNVESDTIVPFVYDSENISELSVEARCAISEKNSKKYNNCSFGIQWMLADKSICRISAHDLTRKSTDFIGQNEVEIRMTILTDSTSRIIFSKILNKNIATDGGANSIQVKFNKTGNAEINFGNSFLSNRIEIPEEFSSPPLNTYLFVSGKARVQILSSKWMPDKRKQQQTAWNLSLIKEQIVDDNGNNAVWKYLDRETDSRYTRLGGYYNIATVTENDGSISIIYISGAKTNNALWKEGMLKGRLVKTFLANNFDLQWFDADMNLFDNECYATLSDDKKILTLNFPLLKSTLRFIRLPMDK